ncbi:hypothetical protein ACJ41O_003396 [Fusarium nematophilum]
MGQRHQLFVIARLGKHYRSLAVVHHQWLCGVSALGSCHRLLCIFSDPSNRATLQHELHLAADFFKDSEPPPSSPPGWQNPKETACPFPFITTCLMTGAAYDYELAHVQTVHELAFNMGYDQGDNNDGITVLDITDLTNVRYCFVNIHPGVPDHTPLTGREYLKAYHDESHGTMQNNSSLIEALDKTPLIEVGVLADAWPWGGWRVDPAVSKTGEPNDQPKGGNQAKSLRDLTAAKLFNRLLQSADDDFDPSLLDEVQDLPGFQRTLREHLLCHTEQVGPNKASTHLLQLAYAREAFLEWHSFSDISPKTIKAALASDNMRSARGISLTASPRDSPAELVEALSSLETVQILDLPDRKDEQTSNQIFEAFARSTKPMAIKKLTLSGLYANGIRLNVWRPYHENLKTPLAYPLLQLLVAHEGKDSEFMKSFGGETEYFYLGDAALTPIRAATGLFQYLASQIKAGPDHTGTGLDVAHSFSCGPPVLGGGDGLEVGPLPAEAYRLGKAAYHSSMFKGLYSKLRDLAPSTWTAVVSTWGDTNWTRAANYRTTQLQLKYAFVRAKEHIQVDSVNWRGSDIQPSEIEVVGLEGFLHSTAPEVDTSKLAHHFDQPERAFQRATCERDSITTPENGSLLSVLSLDDACRLLNQFITTVPEVERVAKRCHHWCPADDDWLSVLGFNLDEMPPVATSGEDAGGDSGD